MLLCRVMAISLSHWGWVQWCQPKWRENSLCWWGQMFSLWPMLCFVTLAMLQPRGQSFFPLATTPTTMRLKIVSSTIGWSWASQLTVLVLVLQQVMSFQELQWKKFKLQEDGFVKVAFRHMWMLWLQRISGPKFNPPSSKTPICGSNSG